MFPFEMVPISKIRKEMKFSYFIQHLFIDKNLTFLGINSFYFTVIRTFPKNIKHQLTVFFYSLLQPSTRPETDFTLDLPRAEQLRIKMQQEKKFRCRCRFMLAFFGLAFFLMTVVIFSLMLSRGKRMFGSMMTL